MNTLYVMKEQDTNQQEIVTQNYSNSPEPTETSNSDDIDKKEGLLDKINKFRGWESFTLSSLIALIILSPGIAIVVIDSHTVPKFDQQEPAEILLSAKYSAVRWSFWLGLTWIAYFGSSFLLDSLPHILIHTTTFIFGFCSEKFRMNLSIIPAAKSYAHNAITSIFAVVFFSIIFSQTGRDDLVFWNDFKRILLVIMVFFIFSAGQRMVVQNIAFNFHRVAYQDRMAQVKRELFMLNNLRKAIQGFGLAKVFNDIGHGSVQNSGEGNILTRVFSSNKKEPNSDETTHLTNSSVTVEMDNEYSTKSSDNSERIFTTLRHRSKKIDSYQRQFSERTDSKIHIGKKKRKFQFDLYSDSKADELASELFNRLQINGEVKVEAFRDYFQIKNEAIEAFTLFDRDGNGSVDQKEMQWACRRIYREKRDLDNSLSDVSQALGNLNKILYSITTLLTMVCAFPIYDISFNVILPFTSILLAMSFIFGGTAKKTFECIIFLFVIHPYDAGDRIFIDGGATYIVKELSILQTTLTIDGQTIYVPNDVMAQKQIFNVRRSGDLTDYVKVRVDLHTPEPLLRELEASLLSFLKDNPRIYQPELMMDILEIGDNNMMTLRLSISFKGNWQDGGKRWANRTKYMYALKKILVDLNIKFVIPPVAVRIDNGN